MTCINCGGNAFRYIQCMCPPCAAGEIQKATPYLVWPSGALVHHTANLVGADIQIGAETRVDAFVTLTGRIRIGKHCHIGTGACIFGAAGFEMGDYASLSPGAKVFTGTEDITGDWCTNPCAHPRNPILRPIRMGPHSTIGANGILLPGADLPDGAVLGANSMAKSPLTEWSVWAGSPAHWKYNRSRGILQKIHQQRVGVPTEEA